MNKYNPMEINCTLRGEVFDPSKFIKIDHPLSLTNISIPGEIGKIGRYKNKKIPYGCCTIITDIDYPIDKRVEVLINFILDNKGKFDQLGISGIGIDIYWYGVQGNMELTADELKLITSLNLPISMTYVYVNEDEIYYPNIHNGNIT